ncbi:cytochrome P450 [Streptomyces clavuligerus]|uniref:Cytochrome P450 monooxygenase CYP185A1 n=1 Tax=Streptomyces clavuligerus TaxID=1901 RepID=D5SLK1_STRCL|nr:cytochrome P450 [Streptomyces clavuligerus]EFG04794.1 Cytochrome P450 monooxygenase CYP185A1 [Streptomyces clavuligerus]MBY6306758.1 cytochrome P450 [Streptomyces clavuligerus]QCS10638.1 cytochrome P450 [Streptomyces clavuligerus]QPJ97325.1 cytochrome P450 [Streptomyces clavuligerus]WDN57349.1 cytochrome P450 [Streptomyces clavuligerus]
MTPVPAAGQCPVSASPPGALTDPGLFQADGAHEVWRRLRRHTPVSRQEAADGTGYWSVVRHADACRVLRDHDTFTSERGTLLNLLGKGDPAGGRQMAVTDPPRHGRLRAPLQQALSVKEVAHDREAVRGAVTRLLDPLADGGVFDFAAAMAALPTAVIGTMMALPEEDWPRLTRLTHACIAADDPEYQLAAGPQATLVAAHRELFAYFQDTVTQRRRSPGDDLIGVLLAMELDGRPLSPGEIVSNCYSLLLGATVTTAQPPNAAMAELAGTAALDDWAAHPEALSSGVEEALRWSSPTQHFMRHTTREVEIGGALIPAGEAVVVWLGSANRDESVFADPDTFDIRRRPNKHIAFGAGAHYCVGHTVARATLRALFAELLGRFTGFELAGPPRRMRSNIIAGFTRLPLTAKPR